MTKLRRFVKRRRLTAIYSDGGAFFVHPSRRCCCIRRMLSSAFSSVSKGRPLCSCHISSSQFGSIRFFDDRRPCICSSFLRRCSNCFFTEISFSNSGLARAKLDSAVPRGVRMIQRSCRFAQSPAGTQFLPSLHPDVCMRRLYNPSHRLLVIRRAVSNPNVDLWPSAPNAQLPLNLTSAHRGPPVQIPNDPQGS